jgi:hypothetical protein
MLSRNRSIARTVRILGASSMFLTITAGCSASNGSSTGQSAVALSASTLADGGATAISACLGACVECVRGEAGSCRQTLHECLHPRDGDGDGNAPPTSGGPRACLDALDQCAASAETVDACAGAGEACFAALPPPPAGGRHHR